MNKRKLLTYLAIAIAAIVLIGYLTYLLFALTNPDRLKEAIHDSVRSEVAAINIPKPKDGKDASLDDIRSMVREYLTANPPKDGTNGLNGKAATYDQVKQAVGEYMRDNPVKDGINGISGMDGLNGKTPQLRCNIEKNRWEIRFDEAEKWQLLNGEKIKCTVGETR